MLEQRWPIDCHCTLTLFVLSLSCLVCDPSFPLRPPFAALTWRQSFLSVLIFPGLTLLCIPWRESCFVFFCLCLCLCLPFGWRFEVEKKGREERAEMVLESARLSERMSKRCWWPLGPFHSEGVAQPALEQNKIVKLRLVELLSC